MLGAWLITAASSANMRASAADWEARFRSEYPAAADRLESSVASAKCRALVRIEPDERMEATFFLKQDSELVINAHKVSRGEPASRLMVQCRTPDHYFRLSSTARGAPFTISVIDKRPSDNEEAGLIGNIDGITRAAFQIDEVSVRRIIGHPSFRIIKVAEVDASDGEPRVAVTFRCDDPSHWIGGGSIVFNPALDWSISEHDVSIIRRAGISMPDGSRYKGSVKCRRWPSGAVFPEEVSHQYIYPDGQLEPARSYRFEQYEPVDVPDSQFQLSAFGLPDSLLRPEVGNAPATWMVLAAAGGLCLLATIALRFLAFRRVDSRH